MNTSQTSQTTQNKFKKFFRGCPGDLSWERPALLVLLILTTISYIVGLDHSGWSNAYYSAAVQAATKSWKAFFFGSFDAGNLITVDKPPMSLWVMDLSARIFGVNSWSILVPQALEGVACVWVLYITIRHWFSPGAALIAGFVLATTPVAALMFRFNNPDALLVLLLTASAYFVTRALEDGKTKWLIWASILIGFGFLTKMIAAYLVIPGFVVVYLLFATVPMRRRLVQILISAIIVTIFSGWWVAIVELTPASDRPYIASSQNNSVLNLIFGYNGLGRITGKEAGMPGGSEMPSRSEMPGGHDAPGGGMGGMFGQSGSTRLFQSDMGGQISWLIPAALILFSFAVWLLRRTWRTDRSVQALFMWAATLVVTGLTFSFGSGIIHQYYTVALAPAVGALVGIGSDVLWRHREELVARIGLAITTAITASWSFVLLNRTPTWFPWLRFAILTVGVVAAIIMLFGLRLNRRLLVGAAVASMVAVLTGPVAYTIQTVATPHTGSIPTAGPAISGDGFGGQFGKIGEAGMNPQNLTQGFNGMEGAPSDFSGLPKGGALGNEEAKVNSEVVQLLKQDASNYTWVAATVGAMSASPYVLATGESIIDIGGFSGSDPAPKLSEFKSYVNERKIHYFIGRDIGGGVGKMRGQDSNGQSPRGGFPGGPMGLGSSEGSSITDWVKNNFISKKAGGITIYDLTQLKS
jgi:4-amino-4-deoxy-L-arabinose transferase-like glycosyltransferase